MGFIGVKTGTVSYVFDTGKELPIITLPVTFDYVDMYGDKVIIQTHLRTYLISLISLKKQSWQARHTVGGWRTVIHNGKLFLLSDGIFVVDLNTGETIKTCNIDTSEFMGGPSKIAVAGRKVFFYFPASSIIGSYVSGKKMGTVYCYDFDKNEFKELENMPKLTEQNYLVAMYGEGDYLYIFTSFYIYRYDTRSGELKNIAPMEFDSTNIIGMIKIGDKLIVETLSNVYVCREGEVVSGKICRKLSQSSSDVFKYKDKAIIIKDNEILIYDAKTDSTTRIAVPDMDEVEDVVMIGENIYVGAYSGVFKISLGNGKITVKHITDELTIPNIYGSGNKIYLVTVNEIWYYNAEKDSLKLLINYPETLSIPYYLIFAIDDETERKFLTNYSLKMLYP